MSPQELINTNIKLVSLPAIISKLNEALNNPISSAADIADLISQDPTLTARLLKVVNSPFYNFPSKIDTISMAVTVLGTRQIRDLVIATTLIKHYNIFRNAKFDIETFWCHSITTGLAARSIALDRKIPNSERIFITGLLHDIGKMLMSLLLPSQTTELENRNQSVDEDLEKQIFGFTHGELSECLLRHWHFPENITMPIFHHHDLQCPDAFKTDTAIVHIGNVIANNIQAPISIDDDTLLNPQALRILGMTVQEIEPYYESVYQQLDAVLQTLYYDIAA